MKLLQRIFACIALLGLTSSLCTQTSMNMDMESNWDDTSVAEYSDVWGYAAANGTEVAIIGSLEKVHFVNVTNPVSPSLIDAFTMYSVPDPTQVVSSIWRDFKTYDHYAYAVADVGEGGLMIFDLQYVPDSVTLVYQDDEFFHKAHNIWIDTLHGRLYAVGSGGSIPDVVVLDIATDPENPVELASVDVAGGYIHDIHVVDHIAYASSGFDGMYIFDFETPASPQYIAQVDGYPEEGYNHSSWLADDGVTLVFCDETAAKSVKLVDVTDPADLGPADFKLFKSQLEQNDPNSIAHNPFILGDLAYVAYYHDGVQVFDISDPENITSAGYYDTYPDNNGYGGYEGCWGVYPYLPSGNILASDITYGLFVLTYTGQPLPLDFTSFSAELNTNGSIDLRWTVEQPRDGDVYDIETGNTISRLQPVGTVEGRKEQRDYQYSFSPEFSGTQYFRIRAVEKDGREILSPVRTLHFEDLSYRIYPTRSRGMVYIEGLNAINSIRLYDFSGRIVQALSVDHHPPKVSFDLAALPEGMYLIELVSSAGSTTMESVIRY